jgi:sigma-B regulation protein RsbU (phosphoserine phosphatase)
MRRLRAGGAAAGNRASQNVMLRELLDIAWLEDFVSGLSRTAGRRVCVYDTRGTLMVASAASGEFAELTGRVLGVLPSDMRMVPVPAHDPPGQVAYVTSHGVWYIVAPVYVDDHEAGYLALGEFREHSPSGDQWHRIHTSATADIERLIQAWEALPPLQRDGTGQAVITVRWGARLLSEWCRRESRLLAASDEVALVGDIAALLTGQQDLQRVLDRIVSETARVMQCPFCSMRLYDPATHELTIKAVYNLSPDYVGKGAVVRADGSVDDQALRGQIVYVEDMTTDERVQYPDKARAQGIVSMLTAGMIYRGSPVGVIRVYTRSKRRFRKVQRDLLRAVAYQAATAIVHAQLAEERLRTADMQRQLQLAGDLQARLVRVPPPPHPHIQSALVFNPSYDVGGDFCDILSLADGRLAAVVADVVGKGVPASLLMSSVRGALRAHADWCNRPGELLTRLNRQVCRETTPAEFVTLHLLAIDPAARRVTYSNAGHEPLLILRRGQVLSTEEADLVLGIESSEVYHEYTLPLEPGDFLLLYTDGAVEARNFEDEEYGRERLHESLRTYGALAPQQLLNNIVWDVRRFVGLAEQSDDLTLVGLRVLPE